MISEAGAQRPTRILVVAYGFPPLAAIGAQRPLRLVAHLAETGADVSVMTARPEAYLPGTPVDEKLLDRVPGTTRVVRSGALRGFTRIGRMRRAMQRRRSDSAAEPSKAAERTTPHAPQSPGLKVLIEELCAMPDKEVGWLLPAVWSGLRTFRTTPPDAIFSTAPPWTTHMVAGLLAWTFRCPWVADFRDPWVRSPWTRYRSKTAMAVAARMEARVIEGADAVVFTTHAARQEFVDYYRSQSPSKFHVVANGCDPTEFEALPLSASVDPFVLLHAGSLYGGRSPVPLLRAVANIIRRDPGLAARLRLRFLGSTSLSSVNLPAICLEFGITEFVEFVPRVARQESLKAITSASALLVLQSGTAMAIPGKFYECMAAGRPILALCEEGEMADVIRSSGVGLVAPPVDESAIEEAIRKLMAAPGAFAHAQPALFDGHLRAAEMATIIQSLAGRRLGVRTEDGLGRAGL